MTSTKECWIKNLRIGWALAKTRVNKKNQMICFRCGKEFTRSGNRKFRSRFGSCCSIKCKNLNLRGKTVRKIKRNGQWISCGMCGLRVYQYPSKNRRYCSIGCRTNDPAYPKSGKDHYKWKGGIKHHRGSDRSLRKWIRNIVKKDGRICSVCKRTEGEMCVDHILPWADFPHHRYDLINGQILCKPCHIKKTRRENKNRDKKGNLKNGYKERIRIKFEKSVVL